MSRKKIVSCLAAILVALTLVFSSTQTAFANEESDKHNAQGNEYHNNAKNAQDLEAAVREYTAAIEIDPNAAVYYSNRGGSYLALKNYVAAEADLKKALELNGNSAFAYNRLARVYHAQGKTEDAKTNFITAANKYSDNEKYEDAVKSLTDAINLGIGTAEIYNLRGVAYYHWDDKYYNEAVADFTKAVELDSNLAKAYNNRAFVYNKQGKTEDAKKDFLQAGKKYFNDKNNDKYDDAAEALNNAVKLDEKYGEAYLWLGKVENRRENWQESINKYDEAIRLGFVEDHIYSWRGYSKYKLHNYEDAIKDFDAAINKDATYANAYQWRGESYFDWNEFGRARTDFKQYVKLLENEGKLDEKIKKEYESKIKQCDEMEATIFKRGYTSYQQKNYAEAIKDFDDVIENNVDHAEAHRYRGDAWFALGEKASFGSDEFKKAKDDFEQYLKLTEGTLDDKTKAEYEAKIAKCAEGAFDVGEMDNFLKVLIGALAIYSLMLVFLGVRERELKYAGTLIVTNGVIFLVLMLAHGFGGRNIFITLAVGYILAQILKTAEHFGVPALDWLIELVTKWRDNRPPGR